MKKKNKILSFTLAFIILILASGLWFVLALSQVHSTVLSSNSASSNKPVLVLLYDSLMSDALEQAIAEGKAPAFAYLQKYGKLYTDVISSYPTMSVSIDSTLLTGTYADHHQIPGLIWFDHEQNKLISYGSGLHETWDNGIKQVLHHSVVELNQSHLSAEVETIHEHLAKSNISSGSINGLLYRGLKKHTLYPPGLWSHLGLLPRSLEVTGPDILSLGVLSQHNKKNDNNNQAWKRFGFNNEFTVEELKLLITQQQLPVFTLAYLPDADQTLHKHGPQYDEAITHADETLQQLLNQFSTWEEALQELVWVVLGDSSQSLVGADKKHSYIKLEELLHGYTFWRTDQRDAQLALALNERMTYIHLLDESLQLQDIVKKLRTEERIAIIAWRENNKIIVAKPNHQEQFTYFKHGPYVDPYHQNWSIDGDSSILDLSITVNDNSIAYGQYPDGLARLYGALLSVEENVILIDALPGYEFQDHNSYNHAGGGSHGSLHQVDSVVPLIIAGSDIPLTDQRLVALKAWFLELIREQQAGQ